MSDLNLIDVVNLIRAEIARTEIGDVKRITGPSGPQGPQGEQGIQGPQGPRGNDGKQGPAGIKGNQGKKGDKGVKGDDGSDGVGIARVEQDIDNAIVVHLTDGNYYTIEMPLINPDGSLAKEVHYKSGGGSGDGSSGSVDLSGYVRRPNSNLNGSWLVYREGGDGKSGVKEWAPVTTDLVAVNPNPFRDAKGRYALTPTELENINNQRDVNEFLYEKIQQVEAGEIPPGTIVSDEAPENPEEGLCWYDTVRLELFVFTGEAWLPCSPLGARVEQGEIVQAQIIDQIKVSLDEQASLRNKVGELDSEKATVEYVDERDEAVKKYTDDQLIDAAKKSESNTFKGIQTFEKSTYFQNICIHNGKNTDTIAEVRGDNEDGTKQLWWKIRGTNRVSWICYPGQENRDYKKCMEMEWDADAGAPLVKLDYLQPPTQNRHAATKRYVDDEVSGKLSVDEANEVTGSFRIKGDGGTYVSTANGELGLYHIKYPEAEGHAATKQYVDDEIAKVGGGSFAETGATTPSLSAGQLFYNTTDKVLYIGE